MIHILHPALPLLEMRKGYKNVLLILKLTQAREGKTLSQIQKILRFSCTRP